MIILKSPAEVEKIRKAGLVVSRTLAELGEMIRPGVTTAFLDRMAEKIFARHGARSLFKGHHGYPAHICASVNEQVVHGIPSEVPLAEGSIVGIDVGAILDGYCADSAYTFPVGAISDEAARLLRVTKECLELGVQAARPGQYVRDIGQAVQAHAEAAGFSVVRELVGHGVGRSLWEDPQIPNYVTPRRGPRLKAGMTLAIEPMISIGSAEVETLADGWTVVVKDGTWSAHFEYTVAVTPDGPEVLTPFDWE
ncbi:MAG TPA: type I methionyl aminopeptidase [Limnochordia bacterium]